MHIPRLARISIALALVLASNQALAENWTKVFESDPWQASIDEGSIRQGGDGLVYFRSDSGLGKSDQAGDCQKRVIYTLGMDILKEKDFSNWRSKGKTVVPDSMADALLNYACAHAG